MYLISNLFIVKKIELISHINFSLDTTLGGLTIAEKFLMITFSLPSIYLYGIGENTHDSFVHNLEYKMHPIFARDQPPGDVS